MCVYIYATSRLEGPDFGFMFLPALQIRLETGLFCCDTLPDPAASLLSGLALSLQQHLAEAFEQDERRDTRSQLC
jgi:hypothetical protein